MRTISSYFEFSKGVKYSLISRLLLIAHGPIRILFITLYLTLSEQGYFYSFFNVLSLKVFVELGLNTVMVQFIVHEYNKLKLTKDYVLIGSTKQINNLFSVVNYMIRWYLLAGVVSLVIFLIAGEIIFNVTNSDIIAWKYPWTFLSIFASLNIIIAPYLILLEGIERVDLAYKIKLIHTLIRNISIIVLLFFGFKLWSITIASAFTFMTSIYFIILNRKIYMTFLNLDGIQNTLLLSELKLIHKKSAITWIAGFFTFSSFTPIIMRFMGPEMAGRFGMTWGLLLNLKSLGVSWIKPRASEIGKYISRGLYSNAITLVEKIKKIISFIICLLSLLFIIILIALEKNQLPIVNRMLPYYATVFLVLSILLMNVSDPMVIFLRAFKKEPFMKISILSGLVILFSNIYFSFMQSIEFLCIFYFVINSLTFLYTRYLYKEKIDFVHI